MRRVRGIALHFYASTRPLPHGTNWAARWGHRALFVGHKEAFGGFWAVLSRFWGELEGAFRGVFEVLLGVRAPSRRKTVFPCANFPFENPRKTRGFRTAEKT